jgi:nucleoside-diphosphate-sugar epimerase
MDFTGKTVLVTGATGFLGGALARRLAKEGAQVRGLARRPERDAYIRERDHIETVIGDITDSDRMHDLTQGVDYVFHAAAALGGSEEKQSTVNMHGTYNVARSAAENGVTRFIHVSTISVYGYRNRFDVTETNPYDPGKDPYHITKVGAEKTVRDVSNRHGLDYRIIRPGMIYGPRSSMWTRQMFRLAKRGPIWIGDGSGSAYPIHVDDVVDLCLVLAAHPAASNQAFNCTPDPSPTWRDFLGGYAEQFLDRQTWIGVPPILARAAAPVLSFFGSSGSPVKDARDLVPFLLNYITYKMDKAHDLLGWEPSVSLEDGIASCETYLREKGLLA